MSKEKTLQEKNKISALGLIFLGLGSVIGGSFFLGSGIAIQMAGPAVVLGYLLGGVITYLVLVSLGHLALHYTESESIRDFIYQAIGPTGGFMVGWSMWLTSIIGMLAEAIAMSIYTRLWFPQVPMWILPIIYILLAAGINFFGIRVVDKSEGVLTVIKTGALLIFIAVAAYMIFIPHQLQTGIGFTNLTPMLPRGIGGLAQATVICTFAYGLGAFAAATGDTRCPKQDIPKATKGMAGGQIFFFTIPTLVLLLAVPWTRISTHSSPFVAGLNHIGISLGSSVLNAIILLASFSSMVAAMFSAVVMLASLSKDREAPAILARQWKDISIYALLLSVVVVVALSWLTFFLPKNVYNYTVSTAGFTSFVNWGFILLARLRLCMPKKNKGKLEWRGFTVAVLGLAALIAISVFSLEAPEQKYPFILTIASLLILFALGKLISRNRGAKEAVHSGVYDFVTGGLKESSLLQRLGSRLRLK